MNPPRKTLIVGTAGRDFHVFNTIYRQDSHHQVLGFTAADMCPGDTGRYPACLSGPLYPDGIPILPECQLEEIITGLGIKDVIFAYSEVGRTDVARMSARVLAAGADFQLLSPIRSMLVPTKPVVAVTAARTGAGKSPTVRYLAELLTSWGLRVAVIRHPLRAQNFADDRKHVLIEQDGTKHDACGAPQRERYESLPGVWKYSGLDFGAVLVAAEEQADVILWDGASNDLPFIRPRLHIMICDPLRSGEELEYFPGEVALRMSDVVIISKCDSAGVELIEQAEANVARANPAAVVLTADSPVIIENAEAVAGRTVVVVEDQLSLSLGTLKPGAGMAAATEVGVSAIISPLPQAVGSLVRVYRQHPEAQSILPVLGYGPEELADVKATLEATPSEAVIDATRIDLAAELGLSRPVARAAYGLRPHEPELLARIVRQAVGTR